MDMNQWRLRVADEGEIRVSDERDVGREETRSLQSGLDCGHDAGAPSSVC